MPNKQRANCEREREREREMSIVELAKNFPTLLYSPSLSLNPNWS